MCHHNMLWGRLRSLNLEKYRGNRENSLIDMLWNTTINFHNTFQAN